eukprot:9114000-Lingulodinium_polyedra.AAC.1
MAARRCQAAGRQVECRGAVCPEEASSGPGEANQGQGSSGGKQAEPQRGAGRRAALREPVAPCGHWNRACGSGPPG